MQLYTPLDIAEGMESYDVSCGPAALAAVLRCPVMALRDVLVEQNYRVRKYMNPTHMQQALHAKEIRYRKCLMPTYGLLFLQWTGPWTKPGVPVHVAYRKTHWVGTAGTNQGQMFYDVNDVYEDAAGNTYDGAWRPLVQWDRVIRRMITNNICKADGGYFIRWGCEIL